MKKNGSILQISSLIFEIASWKNMILRKVHSKYYIEIKCKSAKKFTYK